MSQRHAAAVMGYANDLRRRRSREESSTPHRTRGRPATRERSRILEQTTLVRSPAGCIGVVPRERLGIGHARAIVYRRFLFVFLPR